MPALISKASGVRYIQFFLLLLSLEFVCACTQTSAIDRQVISEWSGDYHGIITNSLHKDVQVKLKIRKSGYYTLIQKELKVNSRRMVLAFKWSSENDSSVFLHYSDDSKIYQLKKVNSNTVSFSNYGSDTIYYLQRK